MQEHIGKEFFENIRRSVKISYFIASIIPLSLLVYFSVKYIYPYLTGGDISRLPLHIGIILFLAVIASILGLYLSIKTTNISIKSLQNLYGRLNTLIESQQSNIINIAEILVTAQDSYIYEKKGHARRVAKYAYLIGTNIKLSENELKNLHYASLLHDIGFIKFSLGEQLIKEKCKWHPQFGYEMIKPIPLWSDAAEIILNHHERYDGRGYPSGRKGEEIPLGSRILFVAEVFDVLTSKNSYREQIDYDAAIKEIQEHAGSQFDPVVVKVFTDAIKDSDIISE